MSSNSFKLAAFADESDNKFSGQLDALVRNGLDALEMRNVDGKNVVALTQKEAKEYKKHLSDKGLSVWSIGSPLGKIKITDDFSSHLNSFKAGMEIGSVLGASACRMFSFYMPDNENPEDYKNEVIDRLGKFTEIAKEYDIVLCHENEKGIYGDIPERCLEIHKALPSLKAVFDPANFVQCGVDTLEAWDMLKDYVYYLHIKDSKTDGAIVPAGVGNGNVKKIIELYKNIGGKVLTLEPHLFEFDGLGALEKEGNTSEVGGYNFATAEEAFDYAVNALLNII